MPFNTPDYQAIRDSILRDILNQVPTASVGKDSDFAVRANSNGAAIEGLYQHQQWIMRQIFPDTADSDYLEKHAGMRKLTRKVATFSTGTIIFSGTPGSTIPAGTEAKDVNGTAFVTTASGALDGAGNATITAQASIAGTAGNLAASTQLTLTAAPGGVSSSALIATMVNGTDAESDASLLSRLLFMLRNPPCGGASHDYYTWAMDVPGVTAAYVYSNRRGIGTVDVIILTDTGIPGAPLIAAVQVSVDKARPVWGEDGFLALAPTAVTVNISGSLTIAAGYDAATVKTAINKALSAYFSTLKPGDKVYLNRIRAIVSSTPGVIDFNLTTPTDNVTTLVDATHSEIGVLGTVAWS
jgi:uncharacterized phage protein gp47/JayE